MHRAIALGPALLAACFSPAPPSGAACAAEERCPDPLACIDGVCQLPVGPAPDAAPSCPPGFETKPSGSCHFEHLGIATWIGAELDCEQRGGHLVVPASAAEALEVRSQRWIGISDRMEEGAFRAVTGELVSFERWSANEPTGGPSNCVHTGIQSQWHDGPCEFLFPYVCEHDGLPAAPGAY